MKRPTQFQYLLSRFVKDDGTFTGKMIPIESYWNYAFKKARGGYINSMYIWLCLSNEIPEIGSGIRRIEYIGSTEKSVVIKKAGKREKLVSKKIFEEIYSNGEFTPLDCDKKTIDDLYSVLYRGKKKEISFRRKNKNCKDRTKVYNMLKKLNTKACISKDIVNGVINNSSKKELCK